ncbi:MAG TPA: aminoacyl-tRNA hydrolase [Polyangia bacterium]|nr:aminoacyl-tRNA hydrolase [Polyangia bacterium]
MRSMWLVVGLGNPGEEYERTRHNIGFMVADELARRWKAPGWREKFGGEIAQTQDIVVLRPQEYMNVSGQAVQRTQAFYKIEPSHTIVVHDEIDLPFGKLRVKVGGGHGGHNGLRSIIQMSGDAFVRVRCGVGKPDGGKERVTGHVLGGFSKAEQNELPFLIGGAADAVQMVLDKGATAAMNKVNTDR